MTEQGGNMLEPNKLYIEGLSPHTNEETIKLYGEWICGETVERIQYGNESNAQSRKVIITLHNTIDFRKTEENFKRKPALDKNTLSIRQVPVCRAILVKNLPSDATKDSIFLSCGKYGDVDENKLALDLEKRIALVEFKNPNDIDNILSQELTLGNNKLDLERFYPILESFSYEEISRQAIVLEIDPDLFNYLKNKHPANLNFALKDPEPDINETKDSVSIRFSTDDAKKHFDDFLNEYKWEEMHFDPVLSDDTLKMQINEITSCFNSNISGTLKERYDEGYIKILGRAPIVDRVSTELRECLEKARIAYEDKKNLHEESLNILPWQARQLEKSARFQKLKNESNRGSFLVRLNTRSGEVVVRGTTVQIQKAREEIQKIVGNFGERLLNKKDFALFKSEKAISRAKTLLSKENLDVEMIMNDHGNVALYGLNQFHVDQAYNSIVGSVEKLKVSQDYRTQIPQHELQALGVSTPFELYEESGQLHVMLFKSDKQSVKEKLEDFLKGKKIATERVSLSKVDSRYLKLHKASELEGLRLSSTGVTISLGEDAIIVSGSKLLVDNCCTSIKDLTKDLKHDSLPFERPEELACIKCKTAENILKKIEKEHKCAIITASKVVTGEATAVRTSFKPTSLSKEDLKRSLQCRYTFPNGKIIEVHQGNILRHPVEYLVNCANDELKHKGGLAAAIVKEGGDEIQEESLKALRGRSKLLVGDVVVTSSGRLPFMRILHVVVPQYSSSVGDYVSAERDERIEQHLRYAFGNVLDQAKDARSLAIPALGTGIYQVPHSLCAKSLVSAADERMKNDNSLTPQEVHFVDIDPKAVEALMNEMIQRYEQDTNFYINDMIRDRWIPPPAPTSYISNPAGSMKELSSLTPEGMQIRVVIGNIAECEADVLVNTASNDMKLEKNPCSQAFLKMAGKGLSDECEKWIKKQGKLKDGSFAVTGTGQSSRSTTKLKCSKIFHVCCPTWTAEGAKNLRHLVKSMLDKAHDLKFGSMAIPALGTGKLQYPEEEVAKILLDEAKKYSANHASSLRVKRFDIVVYGGNTKAVTTFKEQFSIYSNNKDEKIPKTKRMSFTRKKPSTQNPLVGDGVKVEIVHENIVDESTDAIGFLVSENIFQGGQIGKAILEKAGRNLEQEYRTLKNIKCGTVVMTTAGNLTVQRLLHMVMGNAAVIFQKKHIRDLATKCLIEADSFGFKSISLPAVGTGQLTKDSKTSAKILLECIEEYRKRKNKSLELIRIVILQEKIFREFYEAFTKKEFNEDESLVNSSVTMERRETITMQIAAERSSNMPTIKDDIRTRIIKEQWESTEVDARQPLSENQVREILQLQNRYDVLIEVREQIGIVQISGLFENKEKAKEAVYERCLAWTKEKHYTDITSRKVQWLFYSDGSEEKVIPHKYSDSISAKIEKAYSRNEPTVEFEDNDCAAKLKIDFANMIETNLETNETNKVYRRPCEEFPLPEHWEPQPIVRSTGEEEEVYRVSLNQQEHASEVDKIHTMFYASMPKAKILKIVRIQNPRLYQLFKTQQKKMKDNGNEMQLFHGTGKTALESIDKTAFNRGYGGKHGLRFGKGAYFAKNASYSAQERYAAPDGNNLQYMYIARVLVGKYTKGKEGLVEPPLIDSSTSSTASYDSVVDDVSQPGIFVVFYDYQTYPEYLITFTNPA